MDSASSKSWNMEADPVKRRSHHTLKFLVLTISLLVGFLVSLFLLNCWMESREKHMLRQLSLYKEEKLGVGVNCNSESSVKHTTMPTAFVGKYHVRRDLSKRSTRGTNFETTSVFTRWGKKTCPQAASSIYVGYIGGPSDGGGSDLQCLPSNLPSKDGSFVHPAANDGFTGIAPAMFQSISEPLQQGVIHCAVCLSSSVSNMMVPGWESCPTNWRKEYEGKLVAASKLGGQSLSYICMDKTPTVTSGSVFTESVSLSYIKNRGCPGNNVLCNKYSAQTEIPCVLCALVP